MRYIDGFVLAVPDANKQQFIAHAHQADSAFVELGAERVVECWGTDVPVGKRTDFQGAVAAEQGETVVFSWIEWPDKATRDKVMAGMGELSKTDARIDPARNPMPFDGRRMVFGGFEPLVERGAAPGDGYVQGFVIPVLSARRDDYRRLAEDAWPVFQDHGALRLVEAWGDDVPDGIQTDFRRAVQAEPGETVVFSFMQWPSRAVCDAAQPRMVSDARMKPPAGMEMPFDGQRMIHAGFTPVVWLER